MKLNAFRWSKLLGRVFGCQQKKRKSTRLTLEDLSERIVPSTYNPNPNVLDGKGNSLRADIIVANSDGTTNATETFNLQSGAVYALTLANPISGHELSGYYGDLNIHNYGPGTKTYIFQGEGSGATIEQDALDRVFEITGSNSIVVFKNVTITGGRAVDDGAAKTRAYVTTSLGGGVLNEGAEVVFNNAIVEDNYASGGVGFTGTSGTNASSAGELAGSGGNGTNGFSGYGGGLYSTSGSIIVNHSQFIRNYANGGAGGQGGAGGVVEGSGSGNGASGGIGGAGGNAAGGAVYIVSGNLTVENGSVFETNGANAGNGGAGGAGGANTHQSGAGGAGGDGGAGGNAAGGAIYVQTGNVSIASSQIIFNRAAAGAGGVGGAGGEATAAGGQGGAGGEGGAGGTVWGGGVAVVKGNVTISASTINGNEAFGGNGGAGGHGGEGSLTAGTTTTGTKTTGTKTTGTTTTGTNTGTTTSGLSTSAIKDNAKFKKDAAVVGAGGAGGLGVEGGSAEGGGVYVVTGNVTIENGSTVNDNLARGGAGGAGGSGGNCLFSGGSGAAGGQGGSANGGGVYIESGNLLVTQDGQVNSNGAIGGTGGNGGAGGAAIIYAGFGGNGGAGGSAAGGGIAIISGNITVNLQSEIDYNGAVGGTGGNGGSGGSAVGQTGLGGIGGNGGAGGNAFGGAISLGAGNITISGSTVNGNVSFGGLGGAGGHGGKGGTAAVTTGTGGTTGTGTGTTGTNTGPTSGTSPSSNAVRHDARAHQNAATSTAYNADGGIGGNGGSANGGGVYLGSGTLTIELGSTISTNVASGGSGGNGGTGGSAASAGSGGVGGKGGGAFGGGINLGSGNLIVADNVQVNSNQALAGIGGKGGAGGNAGTAAGGVGGFGGAGGASGTAAGGGIFVTSGSVTIDLSSIINNVAAGKDYYATTGPTGGATGGAGGNAAGSSADAGPGGTGGAGASAFGGGIALLSGKLTIGEESIMAGNAAIGTPGGPGGRAGSAAVSAATGATGTSGSAYGGGAFVSSGTAKVSSAQVKSNGAIGAAGGIAQGGGLYFGAGSLTLNKANIDANVAEGIYASTSGSPTSGLNFTGNSTGGGGLYVASGTISLTIENSSITNNQATSGNGGTGNVSTSGAAGPGTTISGGGLYTAAGSTFIANSTIALNTSSGRGGGVFVATVSNTTIDNSTIAYNTSTDEGGGIRNEGELTLNSDLISDNSSDTDITDVSDVGETTAAFSIIQNGDGNSIANGFNGDQVGVSDAVLHLGSALYTAPDGTYYLSFTRDTSVAFGSGSNPDNLTTDQIGDARVADSGETDVGSIEFDSAPLPESVIALSTAGGYVEVINPQTGYVYQSFQPFPGYKGACSVTMGDVNGDGIPDLIVAAHGTDQGQVLVYDGAAVVELGVNLGNPATWSNGSGTILPSGEVSPLLDTLTPIPGYKGGLNVAAGDLTDDGFDDVIVGTVGGTQTRVAVYNGANLAQELAYITPFGTGFTGGATVSAGDVTGDGYAELVVGTASGAAQVKIYTYSNGALNLLKTVNPFGSLGTGIQVSVIDLNDSPVLDIAVAVDNGGTVQEDIINEFGQVLYHHTLATGISAFSIGAVDAYENGYDMLLFAGIPANHNKIELVNPLTGAVVNTFNDFPALSGAVFLAGT